MIQLYSDKSHSRHQLLMLQSWRLFVRHLGQVRPQHQDTSEHPVKDLFAVAMVTIRIKKFLVNDLSHNIYGLL